MIKGLNNKRKREDKKRVFLGLLILLAVVTPARGYENVFYSHEIIADAPWRIEPGKMIPVLILAHDWDNTGNETKITEIHVYDQNDNNAEVNFYDKNGNQLTPTLDGELPHILDEYYWYRIVYLKQGELTELPYEGTDYYVYLPLVSISGLGYDRGLCASTNGLTCWRDFVIDDDFKVFYSGEDLPKIDSAWYCGDTHTHTIYSSNFVEFGSPVQASAEAAQAVGLDWQALTDHSFDLDSEEGLVDLEDFLQTDRVNEEAKWTQYKQDCDDVSTDLFKCLAGEEVSAENSEGRYAHMLVYGLENAQYAIEGEGGGGVWSLNSVKLEVEKNVDTDGDNREDRAMTPTIPEVIQEAKENNAFVYYAHPVGLKSNDFIAIRDIDIPLGVAPFVNYVMLHRGYNTRQDMRLDGYEGLQIWNGRSESSMKNLVEGAIWWKDLLKENLGTSKKIFVIGGTDAHGDFNNIRASFMKKDMDTGLGRVRTCCSMSSFSKDNVFDALKNGRCFMSDGPALSFSVDGAELGESVQVDSGVFPEIVVEWKSTPEFGEIDTIIVYKGLKDGQEFDVEVPLIGKDTLEDTIVLQGVGLDDFLSFMGDGYLRVEAVTSTGYKVFTNPV